MLARDIAKQFEEELTYPGQIKVTVIRESRATEVARSLADRLAIRPRCEPLGRRPTADESVWGRARRRVTGG